MSSAPRDNGEATVKQAGARAPRAESSPGAAARRSAAARAALRMPAALRWALLALVFLLLLGSTWFAARQAPHPDMFRPVGNWDVGSLDWWRYPLERNAFRRQIVRGDLGAVYLLPGTQTLWAVGSGGLVLRSDDGGQTWAQQNPPSSPNAPGANSSPAPTPQVDRLRADLNSVFFVDDRRGWAVGNGGTILATRDGGNSWSAQASRTAAQLMRVVFAADGQHGWAAGAGGTVLATRDGGNSWAAQATGTKAALFDVQFAGDGRRGWAVGDNGTILATHDGGGSWTERSRKSLETLRSVQFAVDGQRGWTVGRNGTILATRDGGNSWDLQASSTTAGLLNVRFAADGQRGWAVGTDGTIVTTGDGGKSWTAQASGTGVWLMSLEVTADGQHGWAVGDEGTILATSDGGNSWVAQVSRTRADLYAVQFPADEQRGWIVGESGTILATSDGGNSWTEQTSGTTVDLFGMQFAADGQRGWAVGSDGTILVTRDGGGSWAPQTSDTEARLLSVKLSVDGQRGWAVGRNGTILVTRDGANSWDKQASGTTAGLLNIRVSADGQRRWTVGRDGTILTMREGDDSWSRQSSNTTAGLYDVQFAADGQRGWVVSNDGTILMTRDGGNSWGVQPSNAKAGLYVVQFDSNGQRGWAIGEFGTMLTTGDGGQSWERIANYRRYWAPWYFAALALLTLAALTLLAFVEPTRDVGAIDDVPATGGAATFLRSDQPITDKALDRLGVRPVVEALSSFIRNRDTEPRLAIAITGEWGNGKSSVMRMLQTDLDRAGFRTAWFNAWHHQQEGKQMSALFNVVRSQGVPQWWSHPLAAWRVRSRLIWERGWFYKVVAVAMAIVLMLLAGNLLSEGWGKAYERLQANFRHHVMQQKQAAITSASLDKLDPFVNRDSTPTAPRRGELSPAAPHPCDTPPLPPGRGVTPIRPEVFCYLRQNLLWEEGGDTSRCAVRHKSSAQGPDCVFPKPEDLLATIEARYVVGGGKLLPGERKAIRAAAETVPPPPMFPWLDSAAFGALAASLAVLFTKGFTVYGLQLTTPFRSLLAAARDKSEGGGKEASGTVERYRTEFRLLCEALDGRLVIFIDDLDRCTPETVNGMLELTNYLADVGRCFIVVGAAMERVLKCVKSPVGEDPDYPTAYLRKLVHIELPVPQHRDRLNQLASAPPAAEPRRPGLPRWALRSVGAVAFLSVLYLAFFAGSSLHEGGKGEAFEPVAKPIAQTTQTTQQARAQARKGPEASQLPEAPKESQSPVWEVRLMPAGAAEQPWAWLGGALLVICTALGLGWLRRNREQVVVALGGALRSEDSDRFMQALGIWNPVVVSYDPTPRHVKRFYNRARLFAAYEQQQGGDSLASDESLVALAAMHHLDPALLTSLADAWTKADPGARAPDVVRAWLQARAPNGAQDPAQASGPDRPADALRNQALRDAWTEHLTTFDTAPSLEQILRFARRVEGIMVR